LPNEKHVAGVHDKVHTPLSHQYPEEQVPQLPPHPSEPQFLPAQFGVHEDVKLTVVVPAVYPEAELVTVAVPVLDDLNATVQIPPDVVQLLGDNVPRVVEKLTDTPEAPFAKLALNVAAELPSAGIDEGEAETNIVFPHVELVAPHCPATHEHEPLEHDP
jgi:hypothetical protein